MAINFLGQVWRVAGFAQAGGGQRRSNDWTVQLREPSLWNPASAVAPAALPTPSDPHPAEPVWAETQPFWRG
ncbi:MAG TPA: hypothetical protein VH041_13755 [Caldimonas sp.]|jgi:hypothetical protein|nr:hypothetical protein [Caldimonas sp.]HEX4235356.1 hypothetical protein [Caldimonas sp.]